MRLQRKVGGEENACQLAFPMQACGLHGDLQGCARASPHLLPAQACRPSCSGAAGSRLRPKLRAPAKLCMSGRATCACRSPPSTRPCCAPCSSLSSAGLCARRQAAVWSNHRASAAASAPSGSAALGSGLLCAEKSALQRASQAAAMAPLETSSSSGAWPVCAAS